MYLNRWLTFFVVIATVVFGKGITQPAVALEDLPAGSSQYTRQSKVTADEASDGDQFGRSVDLGGNLAVIGAPGSQTVPGVAYVFEFDGTSWKQSATLEPLNEADVAAFGLSVSMSGDRIMVGSYDDEKGRNAGAVYVFEMGGGSWSQVAKLTAADTEAGDFFGSAVSLEGNRALIGAPGDNRENGTGDAGSAYVFDFDGSQWLQTSKLNVTIAPSDSRLGFSVSLSGDRAVVASTSDNGFSGAAYVFELDGEWILKRRLTAPDAAPQDQFGRSVSLRGDRVIVSSVFNQLDSNTSGAVYIFEFDGLYWNLTTRLKSPDSLAYGAFGDIVHLVDNRILVTEARTGSAYLFEFDGTVWTESAKLSASDGTDSDGFGSSGALAGDRILIGAPATFANPKRRGTAYIFELLPDQIFRDSFERLE